MMADYDSLRQIFDQHSIAYERLVHKPFFTAEDGYELCQQYGFPVPKNLVLTNKDKSKFWLITLCGQKRIHMNQLKRQLKAGSELRFAPPEYLKSLLHVEPGAASPLGLVFDENQKVEFHLDQDYANETSCGFHPNINTETWKISTAEFARFCEVIGRPLNYIDLPVKG